MRYFELWSRRLAPVVVFCSMIFAQRSADAHGGFWRAYDVLIAPDDPRHMIMRSDVWAFIETYDGGKTWEWNCAEFYEGRSSSAGDRRSMLLLDRGDLFVASRFSGLKHRREDRCAEWETIGPFDGIIVQDISTGQESDDHLLVVGTASDNMGSVNTQLWESPDRGESWAELGTLLSTFSGANAVQAAADPSRIYIAGKILVDSSTLIGAVARSDDRGETWTLHEVPVDELDWTPRIVAVHPTDPDVLYFWADQFEAGGGDVKPDSFWLSKDGGETWKVVYQAVGNLPGFALSPDAKQLLLAGPEDGLLRSDVDALLEKGGDALEKLVDGKVWGLAWHDDGVYAGWNDFPPAGIEGFSLGVSYDEGNTFESVFVICETTLIECPAGSFGQEACPVKFSDPDSAEGQFKEDFLDSVRCEGWEPETDAGVPRRDAGAMLPQDGGATLPQDGGAADHDGGGRGPMKHPLDSAGSEGCGCRTRNLNARGQSVLALAGVAVAIVLARRQRRRSQL